MGGETFHATQRVLTLAQYERLAPERMAFTVNAACSALSISRTTLYALVKKRQLKLTKVAGRSLIVRSELERLLRTEVCEPDNT